MAFLYRLGAAVLFALTLAMVWTPARADFPPPPGGMEYMYSSQNDQGEWVGSQMGACASWAAVFNGHHSSQVSVSPISINSEGQCVYSYQYTAAGGGTSGTGTVGGGSRVTPATCPANSTGTTSCVCNAGFVENPAHNGCVLPQQTCGELGTPVAGSSSSSQYTGSGNYTGGVLCRGGCKVYPGSSWKGVDGKWYASGPLINIGATCSTGDGGAGGGNDTPTAGTPPVQCSTGKCPGQVNGVDVCLPCSTGITESTTATTTTIAGTGTAGPGSGAGTGAGEGAGTTGTQGTSKTECSGDRCTTTITSTKTNPDGSTGTAVTTKQEPKDDFCTKNPRSPLCVNSSWSGNCTGGFTGEGDALVVATAQATSKTHCLLDPGTALDSVKEALANGTFGPMLETTNKTVSQFNQSNPLGDTCPSDVQVNLVFASVTIPLSAMCTYLRALGYIAVAFTLIYSTLFVVKGL